VYGIRRGALETSWPVAARGRGQLAAQDAGELRAR